MTRQAVSLAWPPADASELRSFPRRTLPPERRLWRVVRRGRGPWWFGSSGGGRFDLPEPNGTCYLADDELAALLEAVGPDRKGGGISTRFFTDRRIHRLQVPGARSLADLTSRRCAGFGITLEVHTVVPYDRTRAWALGLHRAGAEGLLYLARHDPGGGRGFALFGTAGERKSWRRGRALTIAPRLIERLAGECGVEVIKVPRLDELRLLEPPAQRTR
ncbi:MAG: RES family NAD+ phosphorylase [bacterium]|nr:RES family NAD+ phosphorylase [bacterium]